MKKVVLFGLIISLILSMVSVTSFASDDITVIVNGNAIVMDQKPVLINDRTMVPLRAIFEALGAEVSWDEKTNTVTGVLGDKTVLLQIDNITAKVNGKDVTLDVPAMLISARTVVPLRFIAESLGAQVNWNGETNTVLVDFESEFAGAVEIDSNNVKFIGRTDKFNDGYPFNWMASGIEFNFTGTNAYVYVSKVTDSTKNKYFAVFLDGSKEYKRILITEKGWYKLFEEDLPDGNHSVKFIRSSEGNNNPDGVMLKYIKAENVTPVAEKERKIEFIGDSYTSGYGNLELGGNTKTAENTDGCLGYAFIASQLLDADVHIESVSGAGATMNHTTSENKSLNNTMAQRVLSSTLTTSAMPEKTQWDYSKYTPQVVVVFLGTNDYNGTMPRGSDPEFFSKGYKDFMKYLRTVYPNATIIGCSKPSACYQEEAKKVIEELKDDKIIHFTFTKFSATAVNSHPYFTAHEEMAKELVEKINSIDGIWN